MKKIFVFSFYFLISIVGYAQSEIEFFPGGLNVQPFIANTLEPRMGFLFKSGGNELRLDIGNTVDALKLTTPYGIITAGADFFTWTLLRKEKNFHFPVDAVDYFFGVNLSIKRKAHDYAFGARMRISHISAHFADGHFDKTKYMWMNNQIPRVYSREFIELIAFYQFKYFRFYLGGTYLFHVDPEVDHHDNYQFGFDYFRKDLIMEDLSPFIAYDFKVVDGITKNPNHSFSAGIKFGKPDGKGISLYYNFYSGKSIHGEYFDYKERYSGIGINLDI